MAAYSMKKRALVIAAVLIGLVALSGCNTNKQQGAAVLTVEEQVWSGEETERQDVLIQRYYEKSQGGDATYLELLDGITIYSGFGTSISVNGFDEAHIVLTIENSCFVETSGDGRVNLMAEPLETVELESGQTIELATQTMDGGVTLVVSYEGA